MLHGTGESIVALEAYEESDAGDVTIVGELNKLASNAALGRDFAGVHYRADGDHGIELGEQFAIEYLQCKLKEYHGAPVAAYFELGKFNGEYIRITFRNVETLHRRRVS